MWFSKEKNLVTTTLRAMNGKEEFKTVFLIL
ncbi:rCG55370 [Rattus norvegicus]|uniref:RCG55370 n=1 Tax=Rattus norvegicus TaxID=10116 RepID=A6JR95_RAT|nr:rCG55370 [Rattus norvegicus]